MKERLIWADYVKGIAIWLMVLCHTGFSNEKWVNLIYCFHMPVFYLVSGYFDKLEPLTRTFFKKVAKSLLFPYFFFSILSFSICWISPYLHPELYWGQHDFVSIFRSAFVGMLLAEDKVRSFAFMPCGPLWFLISLFWIRCIIAFSISLRICNTISTIVSLFIISVIINLFFPYDYFPFFSLDSAVLTLPFYCIGILLRTRNFPCLKETYRSSIFGTIVLTVLVLFLYGGNILNGKVDVNGHVIGNSLLFFYINGLVGSLAIIFFCKLIPDKFTFFANIGASSLSILGTHSFFIIFAKFLFAICGGNVGEIPFALSLFVSLVSCLAGVFIHSYYLRYISCKL